MGNLSGFNANNYEPSGFDVLPAGEYRAAIVNSEMKMTKSGNGKYLKLEIEILDGKYKGRKLWDNLNIHNANDTAMQIARATLSSICRAIGNMEPKDSTELHNKPMLIHVVQQDDPQYGKQNKIRNYERDVVGQVKQEIASAAAQDGDNIPF